MPSTTEPNNAEQTTYIPQVHNSKSVIPSQLLLPRVAATTIHHTVLALVEEIMKKLGMYIPLESTLIHHFTQKTQFPRVVTVHGPTVIYSRTYYVLYNHHSIPLPENTGGPGG